MYTSLVTFSSINNLRSNEQKPNQFYIHLSLINIVFILRNANFLKECFFKSIYSWSLSSEDHLNSS